MSKSKGHSLSDSVTRSPIELFWTAKNISVTKACIDAYDFVVINTQEKRGRWNFWEHEGNPLGPLCAAI